MNFTPLSFEQHSETKYKSLKKTFKYDQVVGLNQVLPYEAETLSDEYALVFTQGAHPQCVAVTQDVNQCKTLPKIMALYPFSFLIHPDHRVDLLIDENSEHFQQEGGKKLFKKEGSASKQLENTLELAAEYAGQFLMMQEFTAQMAFRNLFIPIEGTPYRKIDINRYKQLDDKTLNAWQKSGLSSLVESHLHSLKNL